jgi:hypothetical protein
MYALTKNTSPASSLPDFDRGRFSRSAGRSAVPATLDLETCGEKDTGIVGNAIIEQR